VLRKRNRRPKRRRVRKLRLLALLFVLGLLGLTSFTFGMLRAVASQIPELDPYTHRTQENSYVYASNGKTILAILRGSQARVVVASADISPWIKHAIVAIEDKRFYEDGGIDLRGILRALWVDVTHGAEIQGGSTITQQFVKNQINGNAPTISRKVREAALAWQLEQVWSKDRILTAYLNTIYFGNGAYGVQEASRVYFGTSARNVNPAEAALLAAIPEDPSLYDPVAHPLDALRRRNLVLYELYAQHYLDLAQYRQWRKWPMPRPESVRLPPSESPVNPYFANYVTDQLIASPRFGARTVYGGGLHVTTTLDTGLQQLAEKAIAHALPPSVGPSAALVTVNAKTGQVLAMVGGQNYSHSQFNLATQGVRQAGSAFKAFVLAAALRLDISPDTTLVSGPVTIYAGGRLWYVNNFEHESLGTINLGEAIAYSDNTVFAQLTNIVGPANVVAEAKAMGITTPLEPYFSIGLGAEPATPLEMARAYASLADGGYRLDSSLFGNAPLAVRSVTLANGATLEDHVERKPVPGLAGGGAAIEDELLEGVVDYGTGTAARIPGWQVAGKTGTTENYGDAWFVGFTPMPASGPELVTAVWVGYPNRLIPMLTQFHGQPVEGGTYPALIWKDYMEKALAYFHEAPAQFPPAAIPASIPATVTFGDDYGITQLELDNGKCHISASIDFFVGKAPTTVANCLADEVAVPDVRGMTLAQAESVLQGQPLEWEIHYTPATPGERLGIVTAQSPRAGGLSAYQKVKLVLPRARHGVVPDLVGLSLERARARLAPLRMHLRAPRGGGGEVVSQHPAAGVAAQPGTTELVSVAPRMGG
jgi:penicillin-binding protein 1A